MKNKIKKFFSIEQDSYIFNIYDLTALFTILNVILIIVGFRFASAFGLVNCFICLAMAIRNHAFLNVYVTQIALVVLKVKKYNTMYTVYHNDTIIDSKRSTVFSEKDLKSEVIRVNWDNVDTITGIEKAFIVKETAKGKIVNFLTDSPFKRFGDYAPVKEWKEKDLNITIERIYAEVLD